jgi:hypothetical protein
MKPSISCICAFVLLRLDVWKVSTKGSHMMVCLVNERVLVETTTTSDIINLGSSIITDSLFKQSRLSIKTRNWVCILTIVCSSQL